MAQKWTDYTTADGLVGDSILFIHEDHKGYLWFVTELNGATRYDGGRFQNLGITEGLVSTNINFILSDIRGNVWFATDRGISKYDGSDLENFDTSNGLVSDYVTFLLEDKKNNLWFGTDRGVSKYDGENFQSFENSAESVEDNVTFMLEDRENNIWFGTSRGIVFYDGEKFKSLGVGDLSLTIQVIFEDKNGNLWFGAEGGIYRKSINTLKIEGPLAEASVSSIKEDKNGDLWFATYDSGVIKYDGRTKNFTALKGLASPTILSMLEDSRAVLWFGSDRGISRYDGEHIKHFTEFGGSSGDFVRRVFEDSDGNLWFATQNGALKYSIEYLKHFSTGDGMSDNSIKTAMEDKDGNIWFGTEHGVTMYNGTDFRHFTKQEGLADNFILSMLQDKKGELWFGSTSGICKNFQAIKGSHRQLNTAIKVIQEDSRGNIWIVTAEGMCRYDEDNFQFFPLEGITSIFLDSRDNLWIGTFNSGVYKYEEGKDLLRYTMEDGLGSDHINWILETHDGHIWFGLKGGVPQKGDVRITLGGVCRYDHNSFRNFNTNNGLPSDFITVAMEDKNGDLWFGTTNKGVIKYEGKAGDDIFRFRTISKTDGLISNYITTILSDKYGNLWFGTDKGVIKYDGENLQNISLAEYLTLGPVESLFEDSQGNIWIIPANNGAIRYIPPAKNFRPRIHLVEIESDKLYRAFDEINIPNSANRVTFVYKGISFKTTPEKLQYIYKLDGFDEDWHPSIKERRVDYRGLKPGNYQFEVRAIDKDLQYSDPPATVSVRIYRPFYKSTVFFLLVVLCGICLFGGAGYLIVQEHNQRIIAAEFKAKLAKQEEAERIQAAKMESLRQLVAGVAHDMNNPIGVILSSNDVLSRAIGVIKNILSKKFSKGLKQESKLIHTLDLLNNTTRACQTASERVAKIVKNIRRFVRLDEGEWQTTDIHKGLDSVIALLEPEIENRISVKKEYGDIPQIYCSPSGLNQVFMAILKNATESINEKGKIRVKTYLAHDKIKIDIIDNGDGIQSHNIGKIFDPGFTTKGVKVGVGLGLAICYKVIIDEHKGRIDVSSELGQGATFTISLPQSLKEKSSGE